MEEKQFILELKECDIDKLINHAQQLYKLYCDTDNVKYANLCALVREEIKSRVK